MEDLGVSYFDRAKERMDEYAKAQMGLDVCLQAWKVLTRL